MTEPSKTARSVGETLRHAREDQNLTLEQVAQALHIRARTLEALEANDIKALPSLAQSRGFLRMYAEHLGLDPQPLLAKWQPIEKFIEPIQEPETRSSNPIQKLKDSLQRIVDKLTRPAQRPVTKPEATAMETPRSEQLFKAIGEQLRRQREELEMSIEEVEIFSHVKAHTLRLLETMDMKELPSPVIVRGLLGNYAEVIKLDGEELLFQFADALQVRRDERNAASRKPNLLTPQSATAPLVAINLGWIKRINWKRLRSGLFDRFPFLRKYLTFDLLAGGVLVIVLTVVIIWAAASTLSLSAERAISLATLPGRSEILASGSTQSTQAFSTPSVTLGIEGAQTVSSAADSASQSDQSGASLQATYMVTLPANADAAFRVTVQPLQTAFVQIWVDDRLVFRGRMSAGALYPFNATRRVELLTGDAGALRIFFNSTDLGILGIPGEVVHIVYTVRGAQTITPTVTTTFTPTPRPSATLRPSATPRPTSTKLPTVTPRP